MQQCLKEISPTCNMIKELGEISTKLNNCKHIQEILVQ